MATTTTRARPAPKRKPTRGGTSRPPGLLTWITVGIIVAAILAIVVVKVTSSSTTTFGATSPTIVDELSTVPASVFNTVGVKSAAVSINAPIGIAGQPALNWTFDGKKLPTVFYYGAEFCPYCAAERWPMIVALSRFGTFTGLWNMESDSTDIYPNTPTFTLLHATYTSRYINFFHVESETRSQAALQTGTAAELADLYKYDTPTYIPGLQQDGGIPFISFNNRFLQVSSSFNPQALAGNSRAELAQVLSNPQNDVAQAIIVTANLFTAAVCKIDAQQPSSVCASSGVLAADRSMHLTT